MRRTYLTHFHIFVSYYLLWRDRHRFERKKQNFQKNSEYPFLWLQSQVGHFKILSLFCFLGPKPRVPNFAEIHARGGRGLQRPTFRDLIPPSGRAAATQRRSGPGGRQGTGRLCRGDGRGGHGAAVAGGTRGAGAAARSGPGAGTRGSERSRVAAQARRARKPGRVSAAARRAGGSPGRSGARRVGQTRPNPGGAGARRPKGAVPGGGAARREGAFSLYYKEARRSAGFSLSNQSCSIPITLCFRSDCFFGGAE